MEEKQEEIDRLKQQISKDILTCVECLQLLHPLVNVQGAAQALNGTLLSNATIRVRDSLIHSSVLCLTRVLEPMSKDRVCIERLIAKMKIIDADFPDSLINEKLSSIRDSEEYKHTIKGIRIGRIAHNLDGRGEPWAWNKVSKVRNDVIELMKMIFPDFVLEPNASDHVRHWNNIANVFWGSVFEKGKKLQK